MLISILTIIAFLAIALFTIKSKEKKKFKILLSSLALIITFSLFTGCSEPNKMTIHDNNSSDITNNENTTTLPSKNDNEISKENTIDNNSNNVENDETLPVKDSKESTIHFINTGNSDAILIKGEKNILIDGGDNDDEKSLVSYLKAQSVNQLDYVIATHPDADHIGGLDSIIENIKVDNLLVANGSKDTKTYKDFINAASSKGLAPSVPLDGKKFQLGSNSYMMLFNSNGGSDANEQSLVTLYVNGNDKVLLTGDAGNETEQEILSKLGKVDLLKVGHHGSRTSTSKELLNKINPDFAVITVGAGNSYSHPHKETMDKLKNQNLKLHRTDQCGNVIFTSTGNGLKTNCKEANYNAGEKKESENTNKTENPKTENSKPEVSKPEVSNSKKVYLSATGSKYHTVNNCGKMNPDKAREVSLSEAQGKYQPCSKCN